jgi:hypothetical protein
MFRPALSLAALLLTASCARREEAKPAPESKPSAAPEIEHTASALTCRDGVLGVVAPSQSAGAATPEVSATAPSDAASPPDADLTGMFAPIDDGGFGVGGLGLGTGSGLGLGSLGRPRARSVVGVPLGAHGARAMAVARSACGGIEAIRACHDEAARPTGTVVLDLSIDAAGKATVTKTSGDLADEKLRSCLSSAFAALVFDPAAAGSTSYSLAFESAQGKQPSVRETPVTVTGSLPPEVVRRVIRARTPQIRYCYEKALKVDPKEAGKMTVSFTIDTKGDVSGAKIASSTLGDATLESCIVGVFSKIVFPVPSAGPVTVSYPIVLSP